MFIDFNMVLKGYPAESKVYSTQWSPQALCMLFARYNPLFDESEDSSPPLFYDFAESFGCTLRLCVKMHWRYLCKVHNSKIWKFFTADWTNHIKTQMNMDDVRVFV